MAKTTKNDIIELEDMKLYSIKALCDILKIHPLTIRNHIKKGDLKARQIGRRYYITEEHLKEWLSKHETRSRGE